MNTSPIQSTEALTTSQAWARARGSVVGRLAVIVGDHVDIFPVNHVVDRGSVVFRTAEGTKLRAAIEHPVAFEVDGYDPETASAWSVVMKGPAHEVRELDEVLEALTLQIHPWHSGPKSHYVRIDPASVTGIRFQVTGEARAPVGDGGGSRMPADPP